jgi:hypothetical protein
VAVYRDGRKAQSLKGSRLRLATRSGERLIAVPAGVDPARRGRAVPG